MKRKVKIIFNNSPEIGELIIKEDEITFNFLGKTLSKKGEYLFIILKDIREDLEKENIYILINGSRIDVYPSGLTLSGTMAYAKTLGTPTRMEDLVDIFEETDRFDLISNVKAQELFQKNWAESILNSTRPRLTD